MSISEFHLGLDVDDTLLGGPDSTLRPYLAQFLEFCATHFQSVCLLTFSRESECQRKLGDLYRYITRHIYAFPRKENSFCAKKDLRWIYRDIKKVIMVEDPLAAELNIDWQNQGSRYIIVSSFDYTVPENDTELLRVVNILKETVLQES